MEKHSSSHEEQRDWKKFYYQFGSRAIEMSQQDTTVFRHSEDYSVYDLVQNPEGLFIKFEHPELFEAIQEEGFDNLYREQPFPIHKEAVDRHIQKEVVEGAELILDLEDEK